jgi:non-ribosomal peptide synthetase component F
VGLARGYLNRPELTQERFVANPFSSTPGERLYRTGDLARYRPDGAIEYLGRIDHQVKLRGYRIELGEIEAVLRRHPAVRETVVLLREDTPGDKRLVAYFVLHIGQTANRDDLQRHVLTSLPGYMLPSAFVQLEALPLNSNGKVDRRALPAPDQIRPELTEAFIAPGTALEETVAGIWREVLNLDRVGVHDNFFALGGHSLLANRMIAQLHSQLGVEVPLRAFFEAPTVAQLAERLQDTATGAAPIRPTLHARPRIAQRLGSSL